MAGILEIMFDDLIPDVQKQVLEFYGLETAQEGNYDIYPIAILQNDD